MLDSNDSKTYFESVAHARYVMRRVMRIVDDQAKREQLEPLEHQALIQVYGAAGGPVKVNELAERLDIVAAHASRLVRALETKGLVTRRRSDADRRVTLVEATDEGGDLLERVDRRVHLHVDVFKDQLSHHARSAAFRIFSFYVGVPVAVPGIGAAE